MGAIAFDTCGMRSDRMNFDLRGDRIETCGNEGRSPELQFEGRSH